MSCFSNCKEAAQILFDRNARNRTKIAAILCGEALCVAGTGSVAATVVVTALQEPSPLNVVMAFDMLAAFGLSTAALVKTPKAIVENHTTELSSDKDGRGCALKSRTHFCQSDLG